MSGARRIDIAEWLVLQKVEGQYKTYKKIPMLQTKRATEAFTTGISLLTANPEPEWLRDLNMIRLHEGRIAKAYFAAWKEIPLKWSVKDKDKVATHWKMVGDRQSPLGNGDSHAQHAVTPAQAILNFAYAELEHVTRAALLVQGFDTSVGILHADRKGRDSLVFDLMELGRGAVDALVLGFINKTDFHEADFIKIVTGEVRLHPALARAVVASCSLPLDIMIEYACQLKELVLAE
jgi:CRISPR-associated endonuclease Cas1